MKPESQIDQKLLLAMIKKMNKEYDLKIKSKGSIIQMAESLADAIDELVEQGNELPEDVVDFYNDLFADEAAGYKGVETTKAEPEPEEEDTEPLEETPNNDDDEPEELPELEPEQELPGDDDEEPAPEPELDDEEEETMPELDEIEEDTPEEKPQPKPKKQPKQKEEAAQPPKEGNMVEQLDTITKKPELKAFVKANNLNVKLKNNETLDVWKSKVKATIEAVCKLATETPKKQVAKPVKKAPAKANVKPKAETKAKAKPEPKPKAEKPAKKAEKKPKGEGKPASREKDPFGITIGSLTHKFIQMVVKKPTTMKQAQDAGIGKHPKLVKKLIAMGYAEKDASGFITLTAKGRKVYVGGK